MKHSKAALWRRFKKYYSEYPDIGLSLDLSRMNFGEGFFGSMEGRMKKAFAEMDALEHGAIANSDENRMVGHYWLRTPALAPTKKIRLEIEQNVKSIVSFARRVHTGKIRGQDGIFKNILLIGIGGSALGPQFVSDALGCVKGDKMKIFFFDNTDPDGMDRVMCQLEGTLGATLCVVISKSGSTKETRNGMIEAAAAYKKAGVSFADHSVAVTGQNSELDNYAKQHRWIKQFPMWDWVGGRTSELSAVGLLPAALQGIDIEQMLCGASHCDKLTRRKSIILNPAAQLALAIFYSGNGKGTKNMVILPYKDRLSLFSKYLQQLVMESLGKERNLKKQVVHQGLAVFGNKGSTDQHSYIQQLRDGINNFFALFIEVLKDRHQNADDLFVEPDVTTGDYLHGFFLGTRRALYDNKRESITITIDDVSAFSIGVMIALFERTVGLYASLVDINPYHQPGVEAGKKAATDIIALQRKILACLNDFKGFKLSASEIAKKICVADEVESVFKICNHLAANKSRRIYFRNFKSPESRVFYVV